MPNTEPLAEVRDLRVSFVGRENTVHAVNGVSFTVNPGEVLCILGESGSGKSVTLRALMRLLPPQAKIEGTVRAAGQDVLALKGKALRDLRGGAVSMIFQEPMTALDRSIPSANRSARRSAATPAPVMRRPGRGRWNCSTWFVFRRPNGDWTRIRMNCQGVCVSAR